MLTEYIYLIIMKIRNISRTPKTLIALFTLLLVVAGLSSCKKDDNNDASAKAYIRATNTAEVSAPQDFLVDDNQASQSALAYSQSTAYVEVKAGSRQLKFRTAGTTTVNSASSINTSGGNYYSVFYLDDKTTVTYQDDQSAPQNGKARIRFINLSSAVNSNVDFGLSAGTKLATALANKVASAYYEIDAATSFSLYAAGSTTVLLSIPVTIQAGHIYTVYLSGATQATLSYHLLVQK
jgi:hypothetical protein